MDDRRTLAAPASDFGVGPGLLESAWRFRWLVLAVTLVLAAAGYALTSSKPTLYRAQAVLVLRDPSAPSPYSSVGVGWISPQAFSRYLDGQARMINSTPVAERASELLDGEASPLEIRAAVFALPPEEEGAPILIQAVDGSPHRAARLANAVGEAYELVRVEELQAQASAVTEELNRSMQVLRQEIAALEAELAEDSEDQTARRGLDAAIAQLSTLRSRSSEVALETALMGSGVELFERAQPPAAPFQPQPLRTAVLAAVVGAMLSTGAAWWLAEHRLKADDRHDPAPILGAPLLGQVPDFGKAGGLGPIPSLHAPSSVAAEAYQFVASSLGFAADDAEASTIVVTSAEMGEGKTVTTANLGLALARDGRKVLLVDGDERVRGLTRLLGSKPDPGLTDFCRYGELLADCVRIWQADSVEVPVLAAGSPIEDSAAFFRSSQFRQAMDRLRGEADLLLVDAPPVLAVADTSAVASRADGVVLVVRKGTPLRALEEVRRHLDFVGVPLIGYVFNRAGRREGGYYGYGYGGDRSRIGRARGWLRALRHRRPLSRGGED